MSNIENFINLKQEDMLAGINTCAICRIDAVDMQEMRADVTPLFDDELTPILNVPIATHQTSDFIIRVPYKSGDLVIVVFSQRDIDPIMFGGGEQATHTFGIDDAIIVGGISLFTNPLIAITADDEDFLITKKDYTSRIVIAKNGDIRAETDGHIFLGENATEGVPLGDQLKVWLDSHTHPTPSGESGAPSGPSPTPSEKVKVI